MTNRYTIESVFKARDGLTRPVRSMSRAISQKQQKLRAWSNRLRKVNRRLTVMRKKITGVTGKLFKFGGAMGAAFSVAVAASISSVSEKLDNLAKLSRRLKFPIEELQEWQFVAEQSGMASDIFDKSLEKFTKTVGEAKAGTGALVTILKKTNPELLKQINSTDSVSDAFDIYLDAIRNTEDQTLKMALANAAFGRSGAKMLNITEQNSDAIKALRLEQRQNGIATKQQAEFAEAYNDATDSLKRSLYGILQSVITPMLPKLTALARKYRELIVENKELIRTQILGFLKDLMKSFVELKIRFIEFSEKYNLIKILSDSIKGVAKLTAFLLENGESILKAIKWTAAFTVVLKTLSLSIGVVNALMAMNPIGLLIIGISAAVVAFGFLVAKIDTVLSVFDGMPDAIRPIFALIELPLRIIKMVKDIVTGDLDLIALMKQTAQDVFNFIIDKVSGVFSWYEKVRSKIASIKDFFGGGQKEAVITVNQVKPVANQSRFFEQTAQVAKPQTRNVEKAVVVVDKAVIQSSKNQKSVAATQPEIKKSNVIDFQEKTAQRKSRSNVKEAPKVLSPQERTAKIVNENRTLSEVTIKDETGRAEVTKGSLGEGISLQNSGAF